MGMSLEIPKTIVSGGWQVPLAYMAGDLAVEQWAKLIGCTVREVRLACGILGVFPACRYRDTEALLMTAHTDHMDKLNEALQRAQDKLIALDMGVTGEVSSGGKFFLGFGKVKGSWLLYVREDHLENRVPLLASSKIRRLRAAFKIGDLHAELLGIWHVEQGSVLHAIEQVDASVADMSWVVEQEAILRQCD